MYFSVKELSQIFNRAERTIRDWISQANPEKKETERGILYKASDIFAWFEKNFVKRISKDEKKLKAALQAVKLEKEQIELEMLKGNLIEKDKVEIEWAQRASELRQGLITLEFKLAKKIAGKKFSLAQARKLVKEEILQILKTYIREGEYTPYTLDIPPEVFEKEYFKFLEELIKKVNKNVKNKLDRKRKKKS